MADNNNKPISSTCEEKSHEPNDELNIDSLTIDESKKKTNRVLDETKDSEIKTVTSGDTLYSTALKFEDLNLSEDLLKGLYVEMEFSHPSKIQSISLPMILTPPYKHLIAQAHNGSGKTTCFVLGMLSRVDPKLKAPQALCICPTRELAIQNLEVLMKMGKYTGITSYSAIPLYKTHDLQIAKRPPITDQVVIGTPGTIKKLMSFKKLSTREMKILVFDEADNMLAEDGFKADSWRIIKDIERSSVYCQVLLFSATFNETVKDFVSRVVTDGNQLFVKKEELSLDVVKQYKVNCPDELAKIQVIKDKIFELAENLGQTIIFVNSRKSAIELHKALEGDGWECSTIHGSLSDDQRYQIVKQFKSGRTKILISTDLLARGFDQSQVTMVVNYDLPVKWDTPRGPDYEVYLHRCGRAGRFGRRGAVFNLLCTDREHMLMQKFEEHFENHVVEISDWKSDDDFNAALKAAGLL
ncbi:Helicase [Macleaya cordata]|uniref:RNA helicase n=1 Tax=Macleaya cordata TaxID=56857 RepID=A0A200PRX0_MACCD|nr:Helicase [Macleaya cordata]